MVIAIRGAITVEKNTAEEIIAATSSLISNIMDINNLHQEEVIAIFFTATKDLNTVYPAQAARKMGFSEISLMCMQEMDVENSLPRCIRLMMLCERKTEKKPKHVYLREAKILRPDLYEDFNG